MKVKFQNGERKNNMYIAYAFFNNQTEMLKSEWYNEPELAIDEMIGRGYTLKELHENGYTLCALLIEGNCWTSCLGEVDEYEN